MLYIYNYLYIYNIYYLITYVYLSIYVLNIFACIYIYIKYFKKTINIYIYIYIPSAPDTLWEAVQSPKNKSKYSLRRCLERCGIA